MHGNFVNNSPLKLSSMLLFLMSHLQPYRKSPWMLHPIVGTSCTVTSKNFLKLVLNIKVSIGVFVFRA